MHKHISNLLKELPGFNLLFIDYDLLCSDSYEGELINIKKYFSLEIGLEEMKRKYHDVIDVKLRNYKIKQDYNVPPETKKLWELLIAAKKQNNI